MVLCKLHARKRINKENLWVLANNEDSSQSKAVKTSCSIRKVCQHYFFVLIYHFCIIFVHEDQLRKQVRKGSCEKSMKFKLKSTTFLWAVSSSYVALAKAEVSCCLVLNVKTEQIPPSHVLISVTQIQVIKPAIWVKPSKSASLMRVIH